MKNDLGRDEIKKLVISIAIPSMIAQFVNVLYSIVDRMYIGHLPGIGALSLAGVGICGPVVTMIGAFASLIGVGGAPLASIAMGEKNNEKAKKIIGNREFRSCQNIESSNRSLNTTFFYCFFVKFYVFVYRIFSYSVL